MGPTSTRGRAETPQGRGIGNAACAPPHSVLVTLLPPTFAERTRRSVRGKSPAPFFSKCLGGQAQPRMPYLRMSKFSPALCVPDLGWPGSAEDAFSGNSRGARTKPEKSLRERSNQLCRRRFFRRKTRFENRLEFNGPRRRPKTEIPEIQKGV